jgi:hypothetical protein
MRAPTVAASSLRKGRRFSNCSLMPAENTTLRSPAGGFRCSTGPGENDFDTAPVDNDVLSAVGYLKVRGAKMVSVIGGSFGGPAAGDALDQSARGEIDRVVRPPRRHAESSGREAKSRGLFIVARDDAMPRRPRIRPQYQRAPQPKQ